MLCRASKRIAQVGPSVISVCDLINHSTCISGKAPGDGDDDFDISSDGKTIALSFRKPGPSGKQMKDFAWTTDTGIYISQLRPDRTVSQPRLISGAARTYSKHPLFSPDGRYVAYLSMSREGYESDRQDIKVFDCETEKTYGYTGIDLSFHSLCWGPAGDVLYAGAIFRGVSRVFKVPFHLNESELTFTTPDAVMVMKGNRSRGDVRIVRSGRSSAEYMYYTESSMSTPSELNRVSIRPSIFEPFRPAAPAIGLVPHWSADELQMTLQALQIFCPNPQFQNGDITVPEVTEHYFSGARGEPVHAWYLPPAGRSDDLLADAAATGGSVPLILIVHGGPQGAIMNNWSYRWNMSLFASQSYGVLAVNFHGSVGYGQAFTDSIRNDWGGGPFEDCMKGVDYILGAYPYLDGSRVAALGASYGGYMINWINGHTDRFKCLVNHDGIFSLRSLYYNTEVGAMLSILKIHTDRTFLCTFASKKTRKSGFQVRDYYGLNMLDINFRLQNGNSVFHGHQKAPLRMTNGAPTVTWQTGRLLL
jgi:dipeptidyl aminopeptidase/acylaminoacyl peptidase